jgi:NAD+ synthase
MQSEIVTALGVKPTIDPAQEVERRVDFLADYLVSTGAKGYVLGISGGQDSTLGGRLAQLAVEKVRANGGEAKFVAVSLPYKTQADIADVEAAMAFIKPDQALSANIEPGVAGIEAALMPAFSNGLTDYNRGNVKARIRMVTQYAIAGELGLLVIGTDHAAEAVSGFYTKFGDGAADVVPLEGLTKSQGKQLLAALDAPTNLIDKVPTADLLDGTPGRPDEDELGVSYQDIDAYLAGQAIAPQAAQAIEEKYRRSAHKRHFPVGPADSWWRGTSAH